MKSLGIVRKIDSLGRVVIPKEVRNVNGWSEDTPLEIYTDGNKVVMGEYNPGCVLCGSVEEVVQVSGKIICSRCANQISNNFKK